MLLKLTPEAKPDPHTTHPIKGILSCQKYKLYNISIDYPSISSSHLPPVPHLPPLAHPLLKILPQLTYLPTPLHNLPLVIRHLSLQWTHTVPLELIKQSLLIFKHQVLFFQSINLHIMCTLHHRHSRLHLRLLGRPRPEGEFTTVRLGPV